MNPVPENQIPMSDVPKVDQLPNNQTIYHVSVFEIFWRNFIAGMGRAFGSIFVYFFFLGVLTALINRFLVPHLMPLIQTMQNSFETINQLQPTNNANQLNQIFNQDQLQNIIRKTK